MSCFCGGLQKNRSSCETISTDATESSMAADQGAMKPKEELLLRIPSCTVHLMEEGETIELAKGDFTVIRLSDENVFLANVIKVGDDLQWPLTKDEPVLKLDPLHYLFSLPVKEAELMSYGVTFNSAKFSSENMSLLDSFLKEHSCFSGIASSSASNNNGRVAVDWTKFAPRIEAYNGVVAKAIAGGTGEIVKGIFKCSDAYVKQVQKGGEMIMTGSTDQQRNGISATGSVRNGSVGGAKKSGINKGLKRVRKLSKMTEKMSKSLLNGVGVVSGSIITPVFQSQAGKAILSSVPGEVLLASLDAVNRVLDAAEAAEKRALSATSGAATRMVSKRFGESAGEATEDILATAGHCAGTAWNIFKIRKALNPASSVPSAMAKNAAKMKK